MPSGRGTIDLRVQQHYAWVDETDDLNRVLASRLRARSFGGRWGTQVLVSKLVEYDVLAPPDTGVGVAKLVEYDVLAPPDDQVSVGKIVEYVILERQPTPATARPIQRRYRLLWAEEAEEPIGLTPWGRRLTSPEAYVAATPTATPPFLRWLVGARLQDDTEFLPRPLDVRPSRSIPRTDAFVPVIVVN